METMSQIEEKTESLESELLSQKTLHRGDVVSGTVVALDRDGAWVDIGSKSEGIVPTYEMRTLTDSHSVQIGEEVLVYVLQWEREDGRPLLSLDRARRYQGWHDLERHLASGELVEVEVVAFNRGGLIVRYEGIQGFVPTSQAMGQRETKEDGESWLSQRVGQWLQLKVIELSRQRRRVIFSERAAHREIREREKERLLAELKEGEVRHGRVSGIHNFGVFVDLGGLDGLVPVSELSWERGKSPQQAVQMAQEVAVLVMKVHREAKRTVLSLRRTLPHPWETVTQKYEVGQRVTGIVSKLAPFGAFVRLDGGIDGLIHISELAQRRIAHPKEVVHEGDTLTLKVLSIDLERRHLRLSLRQAEEEGDL